MIQQCKVLFHSLKFQITTGKCYIISSLFLKRTQILLVSYFKETKECLKGKCILRATAVENTNGYVSRYIVLLLFQSLPLQD